MGGLQGGVGFRNCWEVGSGLCRDLLCAPPCELTGELGRGLNPGGHPVLWGKRHTGERASQESLQSVRKGKVPSAPCRWGKGPELKPAPHRDPDPEKALTAS